MRTLFVVLLLALIASESATGQFATGQTPLGVGNCTQAGGYPFSQEGCLNASDLNNALEMSTGAVPPLNVTGVGPGFGKLWLDTSFSPAHVRQCIVPSPGRCTGGAYTAAQWADWGALDPGGAGIDLPIGGGIATVSSTAVLDIGIYPQATLLITGTSSISSFGTSLPIGRSKVLIFQSALTIVYSPSAIAIPGGANITTQAGGTALVTSQGNGVYSLLYQPAPPVSVSSISGTAFAANNTALQGSASTAYTSIYRLGYAAPGDAGQALLYAPTTAPCTLNSGSGDGGSQIPSSDGKCFVASFPADGADDRVWGIKHDNVTDNSTALQAAVNWAAANGGKLKVAPGTVYYATAPTVNLPLGGSYILQGGGGSDVSALRPAGACMNIVKAAADYAGTFHIRDLTFLANAAHTNTCLTLTAQGNIPFPGFAASSDIQNVTFRGSDGYEQNNCWSNGISTNYWSNIQIINDSFIGCNTAAGVGINLAGGSNSNTIGVIYNIESSNFAMLNEGILYGPYIQGVTLKQTNLTGVNYGVNIPAGEAQVSQLNVADSQFAANTAAVYDASGVQALNFHNNLVLELQSGTIGVDLVVYSNAIVSGNTFLPATGSTSEAVDLGSPITGQGALVDGNEWVGLATGVKLESSALNVTVGRSNVALSTATPVVVSNTAPYVNGDIIYWGPYATYAVSAAQSGTGGAIELTTATLNMASTVSGQHWYCNLSNGTQTLVGFFPIVIIDSTHVLLNATAYVSADSTLNGICFQGY